MAGTQANPTISRLRTRLNTAIPTKRNKPIDKSITITAVGGFSEGDTSHYDAMAKDIQDYHLGGIIFSKGSYREQARLTNFYQKTAQIPLLIAMDAEWGMAMRLHDAKPFPYQMTLGAIQNDSLLYQMGYSMANRQRRLGVHLNFSPAVVPVSAKYLSLTLSNILIHIISFLSIF